MSTVPPPDREQVAEEAERLFSPGDEGRSWYVLHARPRCEKKVGGACADSGIRHYLPLRKSRPRRRKGQRQYTFDIPLFPGYAFACLDRSERHQLLRTKWLVRTIDVVDQRLLLEELRNVYLAASGCGDELTLFPQLKRGRWVRVARGPIAGVVGRVSERRDGLRVVVNVTILGTAVAAEVDMADVEMILRP